MPATHQINPYRYENLFERYIQEGKAIIYIGFSSALSGSLNSARIAKNELEKKYDNVDITIIDSLSASLGQALLVYNAHHMLEHGSSKEEVVNWVEKNKFMVNHWFTVDDLNHLKRGGRISNMSAFIGTLLSFKPILKINDEGKLVPEAKVRGRKKSLSELAVKVKERIINPEEQTVFICHGDCEEDALKLKEMISKEIKVKEFIISYIGTAVGTHAGPGALAVIFLGQNR
jgi:DegV family protein with EDD domain